MKLPSLDSTHVLVVGDVMLDRYWFGSASRISQEAPVPVVGVSHMKDSAGGAANVALNIVSLGARCTLVGLVGNDDDARILGAILSNAGVVCDFVVIDDWPTVLKLRVVSQNQQLLRADFEAPVPVDTSTAILDRVSAHLAAASALVIQDYDKGALQDPSTLVRLAADAEVPVIVDPKSKLFASYAGADILKPNLQEFEAAVGPWTSEDGFVTLGQDLCLKHGLEAVVITRGGDGMTVVEAAGRHQHIPGRPVDVYDVTGAGDTAIAALAVTRSLGWQVADCAELANIASSIAVTKSGTALVTARELSAATAKRRTETRALEIEELEAAVDLARRRGEQIVVTIGGFDVLSAEDVIFLDKIKALGGCLLVIVMDDQWIAGLTDSGEGPVNSIDRRLTVLSGLSAVDWLAVSSSDTWRALLDAVQPDTLVDRGDYPAGEILGSDIVGISAKTVRIPEPGSVDTASRLWVP